MTAMVELAQLSIELELIVDFERLGIRRVA